jgi:VWFA-related protein
MPFRPKYLLLLLTPSLLLHATSLAQSSPSVTQQAGSVSNTQSAATPVFNTVTRAVVLDVVAEDKHKHPVGGLTKNDFNLTEDGQPQDIASFEAVEPQPNTSPRDFSSMPHTVLLIDEINTRFPDLAYARYSIQKLLSGSKWLDDPTALLALTNRGLIVLEDYTRDPNQLKTALEHHRPGLPWRLSEGIEGAEERITISFRSLKSIAIANVGSGRRNNLVWISPGFPILITTGISLEMQKKLFDDIRELSDELLRARMTIYTVDPRGVGMGQSSKYGAAPRNSDPVASITRDKHVAFSDLALTALSGETGGHSFYGHENVDAEIASSIAEGENYYTLSYYPADHNFNGSFRRIKVNIDKPALVAHTRDGYYALPAPVPLTENETAANLAYALLDPLSFAGIPVHLAKVSLSSSVPQGEFGIAIEGKALQWDAAANGGVECNLDIASADFAPDGKPIHLVTHPFLLVLQSTPEDAKRRVVDLSVKLAVDRPAHRVRILVRDRATGYMGSADVTSFPPADAAQVQN